MSEFRKRTFRKGRHAQTRQKHTYPTKYADTMRGTEPPRPRAAGSAEYYDEVSGRCEQCGLPIANMDAETDCPLCDSDNFRGNVFY